MHDPKKNWKNLFRKLRFVRAIAIGQPLVLGDIERKIVSSS